MKNQIREAHIGQAKHDPIYSFRILIVSEKSDVKEHHKYILIAVVGLGVWGLYRVIEIIRKSKVVAKCHGLALW